MIEILLVILIGMLVVCVELMFVSKDLKEQLVSLENENERLRLIDDHPAARCYDVNSSICHENRKWNWEEESKLK